MQDYRKRRAGRQDLTQAAFGLAGVAFLVFVAFVAVRGTWGMYGKFVAASNADAAARAELEELRAQHMQVGAAVAALSSERGVEAGVRERYGVARPGEGQIDIVRRQASTSDESAGSPNVFVRIFRALFVW
jgi:cell division protein FtsB